MKNFKTSHRSRDRRDSPGGSFGRGGSGKPTLHAAVCDECGQDCQVPFKPSGDKPIYCSDCYTKRSGRSSGRPSGRRDSYRHSFNNRDSGKRSGNNLGDRAISQLVEKIGLLNTQLDTIINLLSSAPEKKLKLKSELTESKRAKDKKSKSAKVKSPSKTEPQTEQESPPVDQSLQEKVSQPDESASEENQTGEDKNSA
jgi:CxxC-x17-CxxC domain-containing protein